MVNDDKTKRNNGYKLSKPPRIAPSIVVVDQASVKESGDKPYSWLIG
jgi:hypothetical protein